MRRLAASDDCGKSRIPTPQVRPAPDDPVVRWHRPTRGFVSMAVFIPVAVRAGIVAPIGALDRAGALFAETGVSFPVLLPRRRTWQTGGLAKPRPPPRFWGASKALVGRQNLNHCPKSSPVLRFDAPYQAVTTQATAQQHAQSSGRPPAPARPRPPKRSS
ncbi:hypothetical protein GCM10022255_062630 [Dactylosporangium darangshiense]|uniref:Uncharacterized protein n=1 Tax=Dactylosporangium darangshiense TaxID=579108 RepID=A0ABP8DG08_9ACTN